MTRCCARCQVPDRCTVFRRDIDGAWHDPASGAWRGDDGRVVGDASVASNNPHFLESVGTARAVPIALVERLIKGDGVVPLCGHCEGHRQVTAAIAKRATKRRAGGPPAVGDLFQGGKA